MAEIRMAKIILVELWSDSCYETEVANLDNMDNKVTYHRFNFSKIPSNRYPPTFIDKVKWLQSQILLNKENSHLGYHIEISREDLNNLKKCLKLIEEIDNWIIENSKVDPELFWYRLEDSYSSFGKKGEALYKILQKEYRPIDKPRVDYDHPTMKNLTKIEELRIFDILKRFKMYERIAIQDIESINEKMETMNRLGWSVKQLESIQAGHFKEKYEGGYGFSFTEGVMILWERS